MEVIMNGRMLMAAAALGSTVLVAGGLVGLAGHYEVFEDDDDEDDDEGDALIKSLGAGEGQLAARADSQRAGRSADLGQVRG
jgi:hypothetical protein